MLVLSSQQSYTGLAILLKVYRKIYHFASVADLTLSKCTRRIPGDIGILFSATFHTIESKLACSPHLCHSHFDDIHARNEGP